MPPRWRMRASMSRGSVWIGRAGDVYHVRLDNDALASDIGRPGRPPSRLDGRRQRFPAVVGAGEECRPGGRGRAAPWPIGRLPRKKRQQASPPVRIREGRHFPGEVRLRRVSKPPENGHRSRRGTPRSRKDYRETLHYPPGAPANRSRCRAPEPLRWDKFSSRDGSMPERPC